MDQIDDRGVYANRTLEASIDRDHGRWTDVLALLAIPCERARRPRVTRSLPKASLKRFGGQKCQ